MKNLALLLLTVTPFFTTFSSENVAFLDGTFLDADIYRAKGFEPDKNGVILTVNKKIYIHHFPRTGKNLAPSYFYMHSPNPYNMAKCIPSRLSFFNFQSYTLVEMREDIIKMSIPLKKKVEAIKAIDLAMMGNFTAKITKASTTSKYAVNMWQTSCEIKFAYFFEKGIAVWGKDLKPFKKDNSANRSRAFTKK
jgi:hypothetical protein